MRKSLIALVAGNLLTTGIGFSQDEVVVVQTRIHCENKEILVSYTNITDGPNMMVKNQSSAVLGESNKVNVVRSPIGKLISISIKDPAGEGNKTRYTLVVPEIIRNISVKFKSQLVTTTFIGGLIPKQPEVDGLSTFVNVTCKADIIKS